MQTPSLATRLLFALGMRARLTPPADQLAKEKASPHALRVPGLKHLVSYSKRLGGLGDAELLLAFNPDKVRLCYGRRSERSRA